ncbi:MAG: hypothetical protein AAF564_17785 [Bacteroidota bacterium]
MNKTLAIKERPILFNGEMVRAILDGRKTQTRRVMNPQWWDCEFGEVMNGHLVGPEMFTPGVIDREGELQPAKEDVYGVYSEDGEFGAKSPCGKPGDELWVRETFAYTYESALWPKVWQSDILSRHHKTNKDGQTVIYRADGEASPLTYEKWRPSIHMTRWASRLQLRITDVRVERLQEISEEDARAEGVVIPSGEGILKPVTDAKTWFGVLWDSIYAERGLGWSVNPWVWVVDFEVISDE